MNRRHISLILTFVLFQFPIIGNTYSVKYSNATVSEFNCISFVFIPSNYNGNALSCSDSNDGELTINAFGGDAPYSYLWNDGFTGFQKTNLSQGIYSVTVTDANGCSLSSSITLQAPQPLLANASVISNYNGSGVSCINATDGIASVGIAGGVSPFEFDWDNGNKFPTADDLSCGVHTVTVTDANGCTAIASANLLCPPPLNVNVNVTSNYNGFQVSCPEATDGVATVAVQNGIAPFQYEWSNGQTSNEATTLSSGINAVTVTDLTGCSIVSFVNLSSPVEMEINTTIISDYDGAAVSCENANDGSVLLEVSNGTAPYGYSWDNGETTPTATQLSAGTHQVTITDASGCSSISELNLDAYEISMTPSVVSNYNGFGISCKGMNDGIINMNVEAGASSPPNVTYEWNTGEVNDVLENIPAGTYTLTVTSSFGCTASAIALITEPSEVNGLTTPQSDYNGYNVSINGNNDGVATIVSAGGISPYEYTWENGMSGNENTSLRGGIQNVSITDGNGCINVVEFEMTQPNVLEGITDVESDYKGYDISCIGQNDGSAIVMPIGGVPPYTYQWSNSITTEITNGLTAGTHQVTVTDLNGATSVSEITLEDPEPLVITINSTPTSSPADGTAEVEVEGGAEPYTYEWDDDFNRNQKSIDQLTPGWYRVSVTDANGCQEMDQVEIVVSKEINCVKENITITPNGDGKNDFLNLYCIQSFKNKVEIFDRWGNTIYQASDYDGSWNVKKDNQDIPTGGYFYIISVSLPDGKRTMKGSLTIIR